MHIDNALYWRAHTTRRNAAFILACAVFSWFFWISKATAQDCQLPAATVELLRSYPGVGVSVMPPVEGTLATDGPLPTCRVIGFHGRPMTEGADPPSTANAFLSLHAEAFGIPLSSLDVDLVSAIPVYSTAPISIGPGQPAQPPPARTVFTYQQRIGVLPVEGGAITILVAKKDANTYHAIHAAARGLAPIPPGGFLPDVISEATALATAQATPEGASLTDWVSEGMVIAYRGIPTRAFRARKFCGENESLPPRVYTFFIDAAGVEPTAVRNEVYGSGTDGGTVRAYVSKGTKPYPLDPINNPPEFDLVALSNLAVRAADDPITCAPISCTAGTNCDVTDENGAFTIPNPGCGPFGLFASVQLPGGEYWPIALTSDGPWFHIENSLCENPPCPPAPVITACLNDLNVCPPEGPETANIVLNDPMDPTQTVDEYTTAQANAFYHAHNARKLFERYQSGFVHENLLTPIRVRVNAGEDENSSGFLIHCQGEAALRRSVPTIRFASEGYYDPQPPQPGQEALHCANTAYSTIIAHEYGHHVVAARLQQPVSVNQGAFGEGYGDALALLLFGDDGDPLTPEIPLFADELMGPGTSGRDYSFGPGCARVTYPCTLLALDPCPGEIPLRDLKYGCAKLLAGLWWEIKHQVELADDLPPGDSGLEFARRLFAAWTTYMNGEERIDPGDPHEFPNSAHPFTAIEVLIADDDPALGGDGQINNGTPRAGYICPAFELFNLPCLPSYALAVPETSTVIGLSPVQTPASMQMAWRVRGLPPSDGNTDVCCVLKYVAADGSLVDAPVYQTAAAWGLPNPAIPGDQPDFVHVKGDGIVPNADYEIALIQQSTQMPIAFSGVRTWRYGDVNASGGSPDLDDILCAMSAFAGNFQSCSLPSADIAPCPPNGVIDVDDILAVLDGFAINPYPCSMPCSAPCSP